MAKKEKKYRLFAPFFQLTSTEKWESEFEARQALMRLGFDLGSVMPPDVAKRVAYQFEVRKGWKLV